MSEWTLRTFKRPKFTIRTAMALMAVVCFVTAVLYVFPEWLRRFWISSAVLVAFAAVAAMVIYGRESIRAFGIGASIPLLGYFVRSRGFAFLLVEDYHPELSIAGLNAILQVSIAGFVCVFVRKLILQRQND